MTAATAIAALLLQLLLCDLDRSSASHPSMTPSSVRRRSLGGRRRNGGPRGRRRETFLRDADDEGRSSDEYVVAFVPEEEGPRTAPGAPKSSKSKGKSKSKGRSKAKGKGKSKATSTASAAAMTTVASRGGGSTTTSTEGRGDGNRGEDAATGATTTTMTRTTATTTTTTTVTTTTTAPSRTMPSRTTATTTTVAETTMTAAPATMTIAATTTTATAKTDDAGTTTTTATSRSTSPAPTTTTTTAGKSSMNPETATAKTDDAGTTTTTATSRSMPSAPTTTTTTAGNSSTNPETATSKTDDAGTMTTAATSRLTTTPAPTTTTTTSSKSRTNPETTTATAATMTTADAGGGSKATTTTIAPSRSTTPAPMTTTTTEPLFVATTVTNDGVTAGKEARCPSTPALPAGAPDPNQEVEVAYDYAVLTKPFTNLTEALSSVEDATLASVARELLKCDDEGAAATARDDRVFRRLQVTVAYGSDGDGVEGPPSRASNRAIGAGANATKDDADDGEGGPLAANTFPPDVEKPSLSCLPSENNDPSVDCAVVGGGFTLIFPANAAPDIEAKRQEYLSLVKDLMATGGELEGVHPNVTRFAFRGYSGVNPGDDGVGTLDRDREDNQDVGPSVAALTDAQIPTEDDDSISGFGAALMAGASVGTVAVIVAAIKRRRSSRRRQTVERELYIDEEEDNGVQENDSQSLGSLCRDSSLCTSEEAPRTMARVMGDDDSETTGDGHSFYDTQNDAMAGVMRNIEYYDDVTASMNEVSLSTAYPNDEVALAAAAAGRSNVHQCNSATCDQCRRGNAGALEGADWTGVRFVSTTQAGEEEGVEVSAAATRGRLRERGRGGGGERGQILGDRVPRSSRTGAAMVAQRRLSPSWNLTRELKNRHYDAPNTVRL